VRGIISFNFELINNTNVFVTQFKTALILRRAGFEDIFNYHTGNASTILYELADKKVALLTAKSQASQIN